MYNENNSGWLAFRSYGAANGVTGWRRSAACLLSGGAGAQRQPAIQPAALAGWLMCLPRPPLRAQPSGRRSGGALAIGGEASGALAKTARIVLIFSASVYRWLTCGVVISVTRVFRYWLVMMTAVMYGLFHSNA